MTAERGGSVILRERSEVAESIPPGALVPPAPDLRPGTATLRANTTERVLPTLADLLRPAPPRLMGILNVTADSFSDGGRWLDTGAAIGRGRELALAGADIVDVGGESTRPGAERVEARTELARVVPVVAALAGAGIAVSVDTMRAEVAQAAVAAGAVIVNDVSGGLADEAMLATVARLEAGYVIGHWRGWLDTAGSLAHYQDVLAEVIAELGDRLTAARAAGIAAERLIIDPGLGFSKTAAHNWALVRAAARFQSLGYPVLWGHSRKRFLAEAYPSPTTPVEREAATLALTYHLAAQGAWAVRVHDVAGNRAALTVAEAVTGPRMVPDTPGSVAEDGLGGLGRGTVEVRS